MRIAFGGLHTECSTYSQQIQHWQDFTIAAGEALAHQHAPLFAAHPQAEPVPLFHARSIPGGPVHRPTYEGMKHKFLKALGAATPVDGVLLLMHGAVVTPGLADAEGDWISAVRAVVGDHTPIALAYDLHGNVTQQVIDNIDIFAAYRTAPHIDTDTTRARALDMLVRTIKGDIKPFVGWAPVPVLLPGERTSTEDDPCASLYATLPKIDKTPGVEDANLMIGYVWADEARATACAVVTATDNTACRTAVSQIAQSYWQAREACCFRVTTDTLDALLPQIKAALAENTGQSGPLILADSGDNPTGGGVGDRSDVLAAFLREGLRGAVFAGISCATALPKLMAMETGATCQIEVGAALGSCSPLLRASATLLAKSGNAAAAKDQAVLVEIAGNRVILTADRRPFHNLRDFEAFGITPADERCLVVKSGYLSPQLAPLASPALMALTDGAVNQSITTLPNTKRTMPAYPFAKEFQWEPEAKLSSRAFQMELDLELGTP
ncbi:M81 family metallopeptidase [Polycladidibacter hongkongensis]|uniref:M81 family metallopeptidase n=1 Tax=Polycladidibacter hongkongensis TaxID=1647556 RepID=UPI00082F58B5|nr:M81 family metallopeptidase [Pseudovibrio hongkongensis]